MADPVVDPVALPLVACPDCGRRVVTYVARRGQNAGNRFYKCRNHNPSAGGCDFYRWQQAYADHLAYLGEAPAAAEVQAGQIHGGQVLAAQLPQAPIAQQAPDSGVAEPMQFTSPASAVAGYIFGTAPAAGRQGVDAAYVNLLVSVANLVIGVAILVLVLVDVVLRVLN